MRLLGSGERNDGLTSMAGSMVAAGFHDDAVEAALLVHNRRCCAPPLDDSEARSVATSARRFE